MVLAVTVFFTTLAAALLVTLLVTLAFAFLFALAVTFLVMLLFALFFLFAFFLAFLYGNLCTEAEAEYGCHGHDHKLFHKVSCNYAGVPLPVWLIETGLLMNNRGVSAPSRYAERRS